jgi:hypothetical protein
MSEVQATKLFVKYKKTIIKDIGKKALADDQIDKLGKKLFGSKWKGVWAQDEVPNVVGFMITNTDSSKHINSDSSHWVGLIQTPKTIYVYDSFGRQTSFVLPLIYAKTKKKIVDSKHDVEQHGANSEICGQLSLCFLCVVKELGIRQALKI